MSIGSLYNAKQVLVKPGKTTLKKSFPEINRDAPTNDIPTHFIRKLSRTASPNLRIASVMFSGVAAAYVARKNKSVGTVPCSALNHDPRPTRTPFSMQLLKISSSISKTLRCAASGCRVWSTFSQCYPQLLAQLHNPSKIGAKRGK